MFTMKKTKNIIGSLSFSNFHFSPLTRWGEGEDQNLTGWSVLFWWHQMCLINPSLHLFPNFMSTIYSITQCWVCTCRKIYITTNYQPTLFKQIEISWAESINSGDWFSLKYCIWCPEMLLLYQILIGK